MKDFTSGVSWYTKGSAMIEVYFPEAEVICRWCPYCRAEESLSRYWCRLTNEMLHNPFVEIGRGCPIVLEREITKGE